MTQSQLDRRRSHRSPANWMLALMALSACGAPHEAAMSSNPPMMPMGSTDESGGAQMPEAAPNEGGSASEGETPGTTNERGDDPIDLVSEEPVAPSGNDAPADPNETDEVPPDLGQLIPTIAEPGFPAGSAPRLVPMQFAGPITGLPVLFNIYLPPGYDSGSATYPVVYDLHGLTDSRDTNPGPVIRSFEAGMRAGVIGPLIVVFPQSFGEAYYADTRDARPAETQMIRELIPYIDQNFRTLAQRARRGVTGFSMGGFGALAYATKYPGLFSLGIGYDSALDTWETLVGRRAYIAAAAFGNDESSFDQISPWASAARNAAVLTESSTLRLVPGTQYRDFNEAFRDHLTALGIPHEFSQADCPHEYGCPIDREGARSWAIVQAVFSKPATESAP